jgi:ketosteroid isomerase-like protein
MLVVAPLSLALSEVAIATTEITATVEGFHRALGSGDASAVMERLAADALVIESGTVQTRAEYERDHLPDDVAFARAVPNKRSALTIQQEGTVAWVSSTSEIVGSFKGKPINSRGAELMVLTQTPAGWRIRAIHWSDHAVRPKK